MKVIIELEIELPDGGRWTVDRQQQLVENLDHAIQNDGLEVFIDDKPDPCRVELALIKTERARRRRKAKVVA